MSAASRQFKDTFYEQLARIGKSLASGPRLEILDILCQAPRTVEALAKQVGQPVANTSHHLQVLRRSRIVETEKKGVHVTYRLAGEEVCALFRSLRGLAEARLLEIEQVTREHFRARHTMEPVDREELVERVRNGGVTVLDVRPREEYRAGHIPGALSVSPDELHLRVEELPRDRDVVVTGRGPYCVLALEAVEQLRRWDFHAVRLEEGIPDWRARGLPVESGHTGTAGDTTRT